MSPPWCVRSHLHMRLALIRQGKCVLCGRTWQRSRALACPQVCVLAAAAVTSNPGVWRCTSPAFATAEGRAVPAGRRDEPSLFLSLSLSPGLSVSSLAGWICAWALETWSNSHSTLKCLPLLLIGGNCLPDARALARQLRGESMAGKAVAFRY